MNEQVQESPEKVQDCVQYRKPDPRPLRLEARTEGGLCPGSTRAWSDGDQRRTSGSLQLIQARRGGAGGGVLVSLWPELGNECQGRRDRATGHVLALFSGLTQEMPYPV